MADPLQWYNLIFYMSLGFGILIALGAGFTGLEHDGHHDVGHDADVESNGDGHEHGGILAVLGFGKVPFAIVLSSLTLLFGGAGICSNCLIGELFHVWEGFALLSILIALVVAFFGTAFVNRLIMRFFPTTETDSVNKQDLVGCSGSVIVACDTSSGWAQINNPRGDLYQISCRSVKPLPRGTKILTISYRDDLDVFMVEVDPTN